MASKSTLFLHPRSGKLRDVVDAAHLREYMTQYGEVEDVWIPWQEHDQRYFGFATFRQRDAAEIFVKYSPHKLHNAEIFADFKKVKKTKRADTSNKVSHVLINLLDNGGRSEQYSWQSYFAPRRVKSVLMGIGEELHPEHLERARRSRRAMFGDENISAPGVPLVLFHGPPGTGKTHAMRVIAAESGLKPLLLDTRKLQEDSYRAPHLWASVLGEIAESEGTAVLIDEAEILLGRRSVMSNYASVAVKSHQQILEAFLKWTDGLQTREYAAGRAPLIVMATNLRDNMDEAVLSRAKICVEFGLPDATQCKQWWAEHARQLSELEVSAVGILSFVARLSFRQMWAVAELMIQRDAQKQRAGCPAGHVGFLDYAVEILQEVWRNVSSPSAILHKTEKALWTATSILYLRDRFARVMPRPRL